MPNPTPEEQDKLDEYDALIEANKLHIAPVKAARQKLLADIRHREFRERRRQERNG